MDLSEKLDKIRDIVDMEIADDIDSIKGKLTCLCGIIGLSAECKKDAKILLEKSKAISLKKHLDEGLKLSPTLLLKIVDGDCAEEHGIFVYADRLNASVTHEIESVRTIISLYKSELENEMNIARYQT